MVGHVPVGRKHSAACPSAPAALPPAAPAPTGALHDPAPDRTSHGAAEERTVSGMRLFVCLCHYNRWEAFLYFPFCSP